MSEVSLVSDLRLKLLEAGYPEEAIRVEYANTYLSTGGNCIDLAVIDPQNGEVLAIFEVKSSRQKSGLLSKASKQILSYAKYYPGSPQCFVYVEEGKKKTLSVVNLNSGTLTSLKVVPSLESLRSSRVAQEKTAKKQESKKAFDSFVVTCYVLAFGAVCILCFDIFKVYAFSSQQLSLFAVIGVLVIIPHAARIKVAGLEFERHRPAKDKNT